MFGMTLPRSQRIRGTALKALVAAVRSSPLGGSVTRRLRADLGVETLRTASPELRGAIPTNAYPIAARRTSARMPSRLALTDPGAWPRSVQSYANAYRCGEWKPSAMTADALEEARRLATLRPSRGPLLSEDADRALAAARESDQRISTGNARGALEGVPIVVKEEMDVAGLPTRMGTAWHPPRPAASDCVAVARLRAAGAVVLGNSPMTEYGLSPLGVNPHRNLPRNAHAPDRLAGGSSTGSAVAVAMGVVPVALGCDAGGSIRIPAALNGVFGLKPTFGRIPTTGHGLVGGSTLVHVGPIGASSHDLALFLQAAAGPDENDPASLQQPPLAAGELVEALGRGVEGLRIGIDDADWADADSEVARAAYDAVQALVRDGAELVPVRVELAPRAAAIGYVTIGVEMLCALDDARAHWHELGPDVRLLLAGLTRFGPAEYLQAQRLRQTLRRQLAEALAQADLLALPTTARVALAVTDAEARTGFVDSPGLNAMCRFSFLANLTGVPASTAPVGKSAEGLPIGLQLLGDAWDEATVLQATAHLERLGAARVERPPTL